MALSFPAFFRSPRKSSDHVNSPTTAEQQTFNSFRHWGYLQANLDPLGFFPPLKIPELDLDSETADEARTLYCGTIGAEFMHLTDRRAREWIAQRMEGGRNALRQPVRILQRLIQAELFEQILQSRYVGSKRYSLEGLIALIPLLDETLDVSVAQGAEEAVLAMSHRGRLNAMVHIAGRSAAEIFSMFEDFDPHSFLGGGDVKYHVGATGTYRTDSEDQIAIHLVSNPSHLEAVDPVAMGRARAKQTRAGKKGCTKILPITIHGDAAFAGQGICAETLNLAGLDGYSVGGTIHIIGNNLIGFTTNPHELHSSRFSADLARRQNIPIFHINGEDLNAVVWAGKTAAEYRLEFGTDVVIDLIGYRRYGHSEVDDPSITQPKLYEKIRNHPRLWNIFAGKCGLDPAPIEQNVRDQLNKAFAEAADAADVPVLRDLPEYWAAYEGGCYKKDYEVETAVNAATLSRVAEMIAAVPQGFSVHPKLKKLLEQRAEMGRGSAPVNYAMAEALAFGTLLRQGVPIRLSGQDSVRGTFNQRHAALVDSQTEALYLPLEHIASGQARFEIVNSPLSEASILGFEYGFSRDYPEALVLWEAQFGDFVNGAQVIIDQFIGAAEDKWDLPSGIVLLLPHGYEGQGPEHSSARLERFLQLAAEDNLQICQPCNAAQYFHLLRRQALRRWRKPLVVFTPKSTLRSPQASSPLEAFSSGSFQNVIADGDTRTATRILFCSGKIAHELKNERKRRDSWDTAIVTLEQLYPVPRAELKSVIERSHEARDLVWVQEEPANMGALFYVLPRIRELASGRPVRSVRRSASASPATGSGKAHEIEQKALLALAFTTSQESANPFDV